MDISEKDFLLSLQIPGIDIQDGLEIYCGEADIYLDVLRSFAEDSPELIDALRRVSETSLAEYAINVHGLKGSFSNICANTMKERAFDLEKKAKAGDLQSVLALNEAFITDVETLVNDMQTCLMKFD